MSNDQAKAEKRRFPWFRIILAAVLTIAWGVSVPFAFLYVVPDSEYGRIGDGSSKGYEKARALGLAYGCAVFQTLHRTEKTGWQVRRQDARIRLWMVRENVEGAWTVTTSGLSLLLPVLAIAATIVMRRRKPVVPVKDMKKQQALEDAADIAAADAAMAEPGKSIPYDEVRKELGLK